MANKGAKQILIYLNKFFFFLKKTNLKELEDISKRTFSV